MLLFHLSACLKNITADSDTQPVPGGSCRAMHLACGYRGPGSVEHWLAPGVHQVAQHMWLHVFARLKAECTNTNQMPQTCSWHRKHVSPCSRLSTLYDVFWLYLETCWRWQGKQCLRSAADRKARVHDLGFMPQWWPIQHLQSVALLVMSWFNCERTSQQP